MPTSRNDSRGFTLMETVVVAAIFVVMLSIFVPYLLSLRETSHRAACEENLRQIRIALQGYASQNNGDFPRVIYDPVTRPDGYVAFTGADAPDPFAKDSAVQPSDVTASLWLLIRDGLISSPRTFICPSSADIPDLLTDASGRIVKPTQRSNFRGARNLSYSYASPFSSAPGFRMNDTKPAEFALMADKNPGPPDVIQPANAVATQLASANSLNHDRAGENVLFADGSVAFVNNPYCGVGRGGGKVGDNIYTAQAAKPSTQPVNILPSVSGFAGQDISPIRSEDSYLVPTAKDGTSD